MEAIKKILVPIDFSDYSKNSLRYAIGFAKHFNAKMYIVYVVEPAVYPADFSLGQVAIPTTDVDMAERAENELKRLTEEEIGNAIQFEKIIKTGKPFMEIIETASEIDADLIIIGGKGHSLLDNFLFGSVTEKLVTYEYTTPILVIH